MARSLPGSPSTPSAAMALAGPTLDPSQPVLAWGRLWLGLGTAMSSTLLRSAEATRQAQLDTAQAARRQVDNAQRRCAQAQQVGDLQAVAADLWRFSLQSASGHWQRLGMVAMAAQAEALARTTEQIATLGSRALPEVTAALEMPTASAHAPDPQPGTPRALLNEASAQAWNHWLDLGKQWSDLLERANTTVH